MDQTYDVVIVGAGPAGCVLANRLTEDPGRSVLLLEAGPDYGDEPGAWPAVLLNPNSVVLDSHLWGYANSGDAVDLTRARIVGGTSTVNGCLWIRGSAADYDGWAALGNPGWAFDALLPYFRKAERDPAGGELHGDAGYVPVYRTPESQWTALDRAFLDAAEHLGIGRVEDMSGTPHQEPCAGPTPRNVADGVRMHAAFTYLRAARIRPNLTLEADGLVDRILFEHGRAMGVLLADGRRFRAGEVILCAGAYGSPSILIRSGIASSEQLTRLGIAPVSMLPGVGENLYDHPLVNGLLECEVAAGYEGDGPTFSPVMIKARSSVVDDEIDLHVYQGQVLNADTGRWNLWFSMSLQYARSRGRLWLDSTDPESLATIDHRYFSDPDDLEALCDGVEFVNLLSRTGTLGELIEPIPEKSLQWSDRDDLRQQVRNQVGTTYHPSGTCKMGPATDPLAVVDQQGRVYGVEGLRVVDASIFPTGPHGNLHFPVVAAAEKIADGITAARLQ